VQSLLLLLLRLLPYFPPLSFFTMQLECKKNTTNFGEEEEEKKEKVDAFD
jgi:hypothetical protein